MNIRYDFHLILVLAMPILLQAEAWVSSPVSPAALTPLDPAWEIAYQERVNAMVDAQNWTISNGDADNDEGKRTWSPLLAEMWQDRNSENKLNSWISGTGDQLLNSRWAGSFYKAFTSPGYNAYYFRFKDFNASVSLPHAQITTAQDAVGTDAAGDPNDANLDKGWAYFARPDHHMDPIFGFTEFNSENFHWMHRIAALQWAYELPDLDLGTTHYGVEIPSTRAWSQHWADNWTRALFAAGRVEWNSNNYWSYTFNPVSTLYDLPPGRLPVPGLDGTETAALRERTQLQARAVADWMVLENALHYLDGFRGGPDTRAKSNVQNAFSGDTWAWMYAHFGADEGAPEHPSFSRSDVLTRMPLRQVGFIAWAEYRPLQVILDIAHRKFSFPVEIQSAKPHYSLDESDYANWDGSEPWNPHPSMTKYGSRFEFETLYLDENCLMGSAATFRPDANAAMSTQGDFFSEQNLWRIMAKGSGDGAIQVTGATLADPGYYDLAGRDPWENIGQHGKVMILAVKRPDAENGLFMAVPKEATRDMEGDRLFCDLGHGVYFAALPVSSGAITPAHSSYSDSHQRYQWAFPADSFGAVVVELGVARDHGSFTQFKATILADINTRLTRTAADTVQYIASDGEITALEWQKPWTDQPDEPDFELSDGTFWGDDPGEAAGTVPVLWRDGVEVDYSTWEAYQVVRGEEIVHQEWGGDRLRMAVNGSGAEIRVDPVTGEVGYFSLALGTAAQSWRQTYFGDPDNIGDGADDNDFDLDGQVNLIERAFGTDPTDARSVYPIEESLVDVNGAAHLAITYRQLTGGVGNTGIDYTADEITYLVEYDNDLNSSWGKGNVSEVGSASDNGDGTETTTVRLNAPISEAPTQFIRVKLIQMP